MDWKFLKDLLFASMLPAGTDVERVFPEYAAAARAEARGGGVSEHIGCDPEGGPHACVTVHLYVSALEAVQNSPKQLENLIDERLRVAKLTMKACLAKNAGVVWPED